MNDEENKTEEAAAEKVAEKTAQPADDAVGASSLVAQPEDGARVAELERELQKERVEQGRLRAVNDELRKAREEIAALRAQLESAKERKFSDYLTDEDKEKLDQDQLAVIDKVVRGRVGDMRAAAKAESDSLREELAKRAVDSFNAEVERIAPGLCAAISNGHRDEWTKWCQAKSRAASVAQAFRSRDAETAAGFIAKFAEEIGLRSDGDGIAAHAPSYSPRGGTRPAYGAGDKTQYTLAEYNAALRAAAADYDAGRITADERRAIEKKFDKALEEGRITR